MRVFPRSRRGTWLLAGAVWIAACAGLWWWLPVGPSRTLNIDPPCWAFDFTLDSSKFVTFSGDFDARANPPRKFLGQVSVWSIQTGSRVGELINYDTIAPPAVETTNRRWWKLAPADVRDWQIRLLDLLSMQMEVPEIRSVDAGPISGDSRYVVYRTGKSGLVIWDRMERRNCGELAELDWPFAAPADFRLVAGVGKTEDGEAVIRVLQRERLQDVAILRVGQSERIGRSLAFSPDGNSVLAIVSDKAGVVAPNHPPYLRCWDVDTGQERFSVPWVVFFSKSLFVLPDCKRVLVERHEPDNTHSLEFREIRTGDVVCRIVIDGTPSGSLQLSPDGSRVAIGRVWNDPSLFERMFERMRLRWPFERTVKVESCIHGVESGELLGVVPADRALWSPDGNWLVTPIGSKPPYGAIGIWDIPPRKSITRIAAGAALLALPIALVTWRRTRKLRVV